MFPLPKRDNESHKGDYGRILIIAGNQRYGGAAILASQAALFSGAGLVTLATDPRNHSAMHSRQPEVMLWDWQEDLSPIIRHSDVLLMGPGMGTDKEASRIFSQHIKSVQADQWLILDASALHLMKDVTLPKCRLLLTPHLGEMSALSGVPTADITDEICSQTADKLGAWLILKGHRSKWFHDQTIDENIAGTPAMATGGSGDVLAGMLAGFLAQYEPLLAVKTALYLHSHIAVSMAETRHVVLPSELIKEIPRFMKGLEK